MNATDLIAAKAMQLRGDGFFDANNPEPVPSPCVSVCRMTPDRSHCEGCFRTLDEIRLWSRADSSLRRAIWRTALKRAGVAVEEDQT